MRKGMKQMGMDLYINKRKNKGLPTEECVELFYARKFWELLEAPFVQEYNDSKEDGYICARISSEEDFNQLIDIAIHHKNYFDTYESVPQLLEARDEFVNNQENNEHWTYTLEADW